MLVKSDPSIQYGARVKTLGATKGLIKVGRPGKSEVFSVIVLGLMGLAALLVKMPYRPALENGIYSTIALTAFFSYVKLRLGINPPLLLIACPVAAVLLDVVGNYFGLFSVTFGILPYDVIAHFLGTGLCFIAIAWLLRSIVEKFDYSLPLGWVIFFSVTTAFSLAAYYEVIELWDEQFFHGHRIWTTHDTSHDLASDIVGTVVIALIYTFLVKKREQKATLKQE